MGSLFGDIDLENAAENPFFKPDGKYRCLVTEAPVAETKKRDKVGMTITFVIQEGEKQGDKITNWMWVPTKKEVESKDQELAKKANRARSFLRNRLIDLGVPADRLNSAEPADIIGVECWVTIQNKDGQERVTEVSVVGSEEGTNDPFAE